MAEEYTMKDLVYVAEELNRNIRGLSPRIKTVYRKLPELAADIEKVSKDIVEPTDRFTNFTTRVILSFGGKPSIQGHKLDGPAVRGKKKRNTGDNIKKLVKFLDPHLKKGTFTRQELVQLAVEEFEGLLKKSTISSQLSRAITDSKGNYFGRVIKVDPKTKLISY